MLIKPVFALRDTFNGNEHKDKIDRYACFVRDGIVVPTPNRACDFSFLERLWIQLPQAESVANYGGAEYIIDRVELGLFLSN